MEEEDFDEVPRRKKKKGIKLFTKKRVAWLALIIVLLLAGALIQHYLIEPLYGETLGQKLARCIEEKNALDERFVSCSNSQKACEFQLNQCLGIS